MKVSKKAGIALFVTTAVIMAVLIVFHKNPGPAADPGQELAKKIISCVVIAAACFAFIHWYDKFTGLPVELFCFLRRCFLSGAIRHIHFAEGAVRIDLASGAFFGAGADNGRILAVVLQQRHQVGFVHGI